MARKTFGKLLLELEIKAKELELRMLKDPVPEPAQCQMETVIESIRDLGKLVPEDWWKSK